MQPDEIDTRIVNVLLDDARLSAREIAKKAGVSAVTVLKRMNLLEKGGVISGYSASVDHDKLGYDIQAVINIRIQKGKLIEIEKRSATHNNVVAVYEIMGPFDAVIIVRFQTKAALDKFLKKIQTYDFVERTETHLILNTIGPLVKNIR